MDAANRQVSASSLVEKTEGRMAHLHVALEFGEEITEEQLHAPYLMPELLDSGSCTMDKVHDSACSDVDFASSDEEEAEDVQPTRRRVFQFAASFSTLGAAKAGIDTFDGSVYKFSYNYGKKGHGERVFQCVSHRECAKWVRLAQDVDGGFKMEHAEVGDILLGCGPKKRRKILQERYAEVPELSELLPDPVQLKNHKTHLKSALAGGWTLVDFGTYMTHYDRDQYSKAFVPWAYMLAFDSLDRTSGIANAYLEIWPEITLLNCYPHFSGKTRSKKQFGALANIILSYWRSQGESEYADWMGQYYMGNLWGNWFYTAAIPGLTPSQNALESHHKDDIKITTMLETLPVRKSSGGQRKQIGSLVKDSTDSHQFSVDVLMHDFLRHPLHPVRWTVMKAFPISEKIMNGLTHHLQGKETSWRESRGRYYWLLKFSDLRRLQHGPPGESSKLRTAEAVVANITMVPQHGSPGESSKTLSRGSAGSDITMAVFTFAAKDHLVTRTNMATPEDARELLTMSESDSNDQRSQTLKTDSAAAAKNYPYGYGWPFATSGDDVDLDAKNEPQEEEEMQLTSASDDASGSFNNPFDFFITLFNLTQSASGSGSGFSLTSEELDSMREVIGKTKDLQKMKKKKTGALRIGVDDDDTE
ncbi:hypothetical protein PHYSODRAFT_339924 [Phytophthora sojae]|uniref:Uncharacterized protein n=1 Tax=Phytophthora sojae (strain P6497) TaxID=1094619 RepID=G5A830_PHYSP|nr:hypothetical protein PHYSODRAFT_339924 [Phytophthora sojae]EGZ08056.1 hypothetical protein PHYSODRAFT_339924 [Phytophthora sojae]|eukprot:XP_009536228.1 hypothetical protein PHYSODRAFT_339924 [Phytophthora sojae]